ncbi:MAG TPA: RNA polymerase sigma factor [Xanthobacteraceae bacterium]|nr:RNA polymerase sigma factor [Xanthobacteraceae bacterium]
MPVDRKTRSPVDPNDLARAAIAGDQAALVALIELLRNDVYRLALRMLGHPADAEDAAQEALIQIVTGLSSFRGESSVRTWAFRIASRHYMRFRVGRYESMVEGFDSIDQVMASYATVPPASFNEAETKILAEQVMSNCVGAILLALNRDERIAYSLAEVFGFSGSECADILDIDEATFRKRLQRGRDALESYMKRSCGLVNANNACRCARQIPVHLAYDFIRPDELLARRRAAPSKSAVSADRLREMTEIERVACLYRDDVEDAPESLVARMREFIGRGGLAALD